MRIPKEKAPRAAQIFFSRPCVTLVLVVLSSLPIWAQATAQATLITSNVLHRTFRIKWGNCTGTAFAMDRASRQYLITARHVVDGLESGNLIKVLYKEEWKDLAVDVVGIGKGKVDVAVLACSIRLSPPLQLAASDSGLVYGQSVSFLGYPFGWDSGSEEINRGIPLPFVKAGIVSAMVFGDVSMIFLDAHVNKGFSGGPVVFVPNGRPRNELSVAGIISGGCLS